MITIALWKLCTIDNLCWNICDLSDFIELTLNIMFALLITPFVLIADIICFPVEIILLLKFLILDSGIIKRLFKRVSKKIKYYKEKEVHYERNDLQK